MSSFDREMAVAYGDSCQAKKWSNKTITFSDLCERLQTTVRTTESAEEYAKMTKLQRGRIKDKGCFVGGQLRGGSRKRGNVIVRSMLTMDSDDAPKGFIEQYSQQGINASCIYTTHGHLPDKPRVRIIVPLKRDVTPEEYVALARFFASDWGIDGFDVCSYRVHQPMFWPTTPANGEFLCKVTEGEWLDPDEVLAKHPDWQDCSTLPTSSKESMVQTQVGKKQQDPLAKEGIIGAFCRAYNIREAIDTFLSDVYEPCDHTDDAYTYVKGSTVAGLKIYDDKFAYSYHATDPASGKECNAFDLVRLHKFGEMEDKASVTAMMDFARKDSRVKEELLESRRREAESDFANWEDGLELDKKGNVCNTLKNLLLILQKAPELQGICFNRLADNMEIKGEVPWKHPSRFWRDADDAQLTCYVESAYGTFSKRNYDLAVVKVADDRSYHPVLEYLDSLPEWDGIRRVDSLFIDYLGAADNDYVRVVTRKILCAAIMRVRHPGIKFDPMLVFNGPQGIGKSTLVARLGGEWYSDSLSMSDMNDKTAAEKLQGYWIIEISELAGLRKAEIDKIKSFVSRQDDKYRASFGRRVSPHPRQSVFFGTTNAENGFLRDTTGNRRYWPVKTPGSRQKHPWDISDEEVRQIWAEAVTYAESGERLELPAGIEAMARKEQREAMEGDDREGLVREYLDTLLPTSWDTMNVYQRREYMENPSSPVNPAGVVKRQTVCNMAIWCECFGRRKEEMRPADSYAITAIMVKIEGWEKDGRQRFLIYGLQRCYRRMD